MKAPRIIGAIFGAAALISTAGAAHADKQSPLQAGAKQAWQVQQGLEEKPPQATPIQTPSAGASARDNRCSILLRQQEQLSFPIVLIKDDPDSIECQRQLNQAVTMRWFKKYILKR